MKGSGEADARDPRNLARHSVGRRETPEPGRGRTGRAHLDPLGGRASRGRRAPRHATTRRSSLRRVVRELYQDPVEILQRTFEDVGGYDEIVALRDIPFQSCCEHHMAAIQGTVHVGYLPRSRVVGISKLARVVDAYARRLQVQERLTAQIADTIDEVLKPRGVAVVVKATHACMSTRGVRGAGRWRSACRVPQAQPEEHPWLELRDRTCSLTSTNYTWT